MNNILTCFFLFLTYINISYAQEVNSEKSFQKVTITEVEEKLKNEKNKKLKKKLANQYVRLVKEKNNNLILANTYYLISEAYSHSDYAVIYADSIIQVSNTLNSEIFPAKGYLQKGIQLYYSGKFEEALKNYILANEFYIKQDDKFKQLIIKHYIGLLKNKINEIDEAFDIFKSNMSFFKQSKNKEKYNRQYLKSLFALTNGYLYYKKLDSALFYSKEGLKFSSKNNKYLYPHFLLSYGGVKMFQKKYKVALDSMIKGNSLMSDKKISVAMNYIHISNIYDSINNKEKSIIYLEKVDSTYQKNSQVIHQARNAYENLLRKYQNANNTKKQLEIIKKLLSVDSILKKTSKNISKQIIENYDRPKLIAEKERLIDNLKKNNKHVEIINWTLVLIAIILCISIIYITRKNIINKRRFQAILNKNKVNNKIVIKATKTDTKDIIGLPEDKIKSITQKLEKFEKTNRFTKKQYTINMLAKELGTNSNYLSKIININKKTSFSQYINNLRIDYAVDQLTKQPILRSYTIKAIANEFGFNTAQSFANAFQKRTEIYPSYFLKQLKIQKNNTIDKS